MVRVAANASFLKALREKEGTVARRKADAIQTAWQESTLIYRGKKRPSDQAATVLGYEFDLPGLLLRMHAVVIQLKVHPETSLFYPEKPSGRGGVWLGFQPMGLGKRILDLLAQDLGCIERIYCDHRFHPYIEEFLTLGENRALLHLGTRAASPILTSPEQIEALNTFVKVLKEQVTAVDVPKKVSNFRRSSNKNHRRFRECAELIVRGTYGSVAIERYDLGYSTASEQLYERAGVSYEQAKGHFDKFLSFLSKTVTKSRLKGYVWKLEFSANRGYQYHLMLILDLQGHDSHKLYQQLKTQWDQFIDEVDITSNDLVEEDPPETTGKAQPDRLGEAPRLADQENLPESRGEGRSNPANTCRGSLAKATDFTGKAYKAAAVGVHMFPMNASERNLLSAELDKAAIYFTQIESFCKLKQGDKKRRAFGAGGIMSGKKYPVGY